MLGSDTVTRLCGQIAVVLTARLLGPNEYGVLAAGLAVLSLAIVLADLGVGDSAVQRLTRSPDGEATFVGEVMPLRVATSLPFVAMGGAVALSWSNPTIRASGLLLMAVPFASLVTSRILAARISELFARAARWMALLGLSQAVGALIAVWLIGQTGVVAASGAAVALVAVGLVAGRTNAWRLPTKTQSTQWLKAAVPFGVTASAVAFYSRTDRVVVAALVGTSAAGDYVAAYNVVMVASIAGAALHAAVLPRLLSESRSGLEARWGRRALGILALTLPLAIVLWAFSPVIVSALYGPTYESSATVLRILSPLVVLYVLNPFLASLLIAAGQQRTLAAVAVTTAGVAFAAYPLLTIWFGAFGAAFASVVAELISTGLVARSLRRRGSTEVIDTDRTTS